MLRRLLSAAALVLVAASAHAATVAVGAQAIDCSPQGVKTIAYGSGSACLTASPTATSTPTPTATVTPTSTPSPTATNTPIPLPLSVTNGGTHANLSGTGGTSQVLKQTSVGGDVTVARLACSDLSDSAGGCSAATGASTTLNNLGTTSINAALLPSATGKDIGAAATPFEYLFLHGAGTFGTGSFRIGGTPTAARQIALQDATYTAAGLETAQTFTASQQFNDGQNLVYGQLYFGDNAPAGNAGNNYIARETAQTPDSMTFGVASTSRSINVKRTTEVQGGNDVQNGPCGTAACTNPQVIIHKGSTSTVDYQSIGASGLSGKFVKALTESTATAVIEIPIAAAAGGGGEIHYTVFASDTTDHQTRSGVVRFSGVNKAGTMTCSVYGVDSAFTANPDQTKDGSGAGAISSGTLTYAWTAVAATAACDYKLNVVSSLTQTTLDFYGRVDLIGPREPVLQ